MATASPVPSTTAPVESLNVLDGTILIQIPAGSFRMGSDDPKAPAEEQPAHDVELSAYAIGKLEVSNAQFAAFVTATGWRTRAEELGKGGCLDDQTLKMKWHSGASWRDPRGDGKKPPADHPVVQVTWDDAQAYASWAGLRLPTEAEWERAARWDPAGRRTLRYPWGDDPPARGGPLVGNVFDEKAHKRWSCSNPFWGYDDGFVETAPVGSFPRGASPAGALDMAGNVWEWCEDAFDETFYAQAPARDPVNRAPPGESVLRATRGGSFAPPVTFVRSACRGRLHSDVPLETQGFRLAR
jgi:formylglycine-generating enzyme required for sulfatase activity